MILDMREKNNSIDNRTAAKNEAIFLYMLQFALNRIGHCPSVAVQMSLSQKEGRVLMVS